ncbi:hypothetical protein GCM10011390_20680 [Aureimonas endophytica]|uniref:Addiction module killer protein n=2 Tax=Aureimonas endophytica TaxID=2027858 RepID=A0A917E534_9HYPH|nr:hypothetical protein GCM10011390_20680 [Aureimonas endophytica]
MDDGRFGDHKSIGDGVSQLRSDLGPGYRVYYSQRGNVVVILVCGGDKSIQQSYFRKTKELAADLED